MSKELPSSHLVVFDVDGTMMPDSPDQNTGRAFWHMNKHGLLATDAEKLDRFEQMREQLLNEEDFNYDLLLEYSSLVVEEFDSHIRGMKVDLVKQVFEDQADHLASELYPEVIEEIEIRRDHGDALGIVSGSPDYFIQALKRRLNFDYAIGTQFPTYKDEIHLHKPVIVRSAEKHIIIEKWRERLSKKLGTQALFAAAYGDTMSDFSMLAQAEEPVCVNPKPTLRDHAEANNWRIIDTAA